MLNVLTSICETKDGEEAGGLRILALAETSADLSIEFLFTSCIGQPSQRMIVRCSGVREWVVRCGYIGSAELRSDHPVLLPFVDPVSDLFFSNPAADPTSVVGELADRHHALVGSWIPFRRFLNAKPEGVAALLRCPCGKLASGPVSLLLAYQEVLTACQVNSSLLPPSPLKYWDGDTLREQTKPLYALILGESFVIAEQFEEDESTANNAIQRISDPRHTSCGAGVAPKSEIR